MIDSNPYKSTNVEVLGSENPENIQFDKRDVLRLVVAISCFPLAILLFIGELFVDVFLTAGGREPFPFGATGSWISNCIGVFGSGAIAVLGCYLGFKSCSKTSYWFGIFAVFPNLLWFSLIVFIVWSSNAFAANH